EMGDGTATSVAAHMIDLVGHGIIDKVGFKSTFLSYDISVADAVIHSSVPVYDYTDSTGKNFRITPTYKDSLTIGTLIRSGAEIPGVTYVTNKTFDGSLYVIQTAEPIYNYLGNEPSAYLQKPIDDASVATAYKFLQLDGLKLTSNHLPGYTTTGTPNAEEGLEKIYSMLEDEGILRGLTNPEMINYRYVVDTMAYGLRPNLGGKVYLSRLAKKRGKTTAIISAPSMTQFSTSQDPYFCDVFVSGVDPKPIFSTEYIPVGGNPDMPRSFRFTLPDEDNGSKFTGVFGPFLKYTENDKVILVPPAADISNSFVRKFLGGDPYAIVANKNGIISNPNLAGVEYMLDKEDRSYLEPFGYNSIIERTSTGEVLIYANRTAYQTVKSDFNYLHVRELLNTIELQVEEVLKNYVFDFNNPVTRLTIINAVTPILESMKDAGALINYQITMDESNNTPDIVDEGLAIIDIGVWVTKGMEKIIQRITVYKTGGVSTGSNSTL
ncbi:MAG TPA: phage tail sheath C-terminal domain-containing protein, partial [Candidatus Paceibacterota bacterium]|nr:phage tail sheath C-terminal domain-containing protein [Candidatus Paceibacterota bacterium]